MVKGIEVFREYFRDFEDQYVLIGGAACAVSFENDQLEFRSTRDLDMVLIAEALTKEFAQQFWKFIHDGKYQIAGISSGKPRFYRFSKPEKTNYPSMIELFSRTEYILNDPGIITPVHIEDHVSSLSAILLNHSYYEGLLRGRKIIDGVSVLSHSWLIPFKAKAWLDLKEKSVNGIHVDSRDLKKHRNDIIRMAAELTLERCELPEEIRNDMACFIKTVNITDRDLLNLGLKNILAEDIRRILVRYYL